MEKNNELFLTTQEQERYNLFINIRQIKNSELPVSKQLAQLQGTPLAITDINLKQVALRLGKTYGYIYNNFMNLVADFSQLLGVKQPTIAQIFATSADAYRWYLVQNSIGYQTLEALFNNHQVTFDQLAKKFEVSHATMLRHTAGLKRLAKMLGVRITNQPLKFKGDEKSIRLIFQLAYWSATNGYIWPFQHLSHDDAAKILMSMNTQPRSKINRVAEDMGSYLVAVSAMRIWQEKLVDLNDVTNDLNFHHDNLFQRLSELELVGSNLIPKLGRRQERAETNTFNFLYNFAPIFLISDDDYIEITNLRFKHYSPKIWALVDAFIDQYPINLNFETQKGMDQIAMLRANLMSMTLSTTVFKRDINRFLMVRFFQQETSVIDSEQLYEAAKTTMQTLVADPRFKSFAPYWLSLASTYYELCRHLAAADEQSEKLQVGLSLEHSYVAYVDLLEFLNGIPFINVARPSQEPETLDFYITTSEASRPLTIKADCAVYRWRAANQVERLGQLYSILRAAWLQKNADESSQVLQQIGYDQRHATQSSPSV